MFVLTSMVGSLHEFIGVLQQGADVLSGQAGLGIRRRTAILDQQLPHLASLYAYKGLELADHQRRNAVNSHPLGQVPAVFTKAFDGEALLNTEVDHARVELVGQPL